MCNELIRYRTTGTPLATPLARTVLARLVMDICCLFTQVFEQHRPEAVHLLRLNFIGCIAVQKSQLVNGMCIKLQARLHTCPSLCVVALGACSD